MASAELQAPETFTKRTVNSGDRTLSFITRHIARGFKIVRSGPPVGLDIVETLRGTNSTRHMLPCDVEVGIALYEGRGDASIEKIFELYGVTYLEFKTLMVDSIGRKFRPCVSRLPCGFWYWASHNLACDPAPDTVH